MRSWTGQTMFCGSSSMSAVQDATVTLRVKPKQLVDRCLRVERKVKCFAVLQFSVVGLMRWTLTGARAINAVAS